MRTTLFVFLGLAVALTAQAQQNPSPTPGTLPSAPTETTAKTLEENPLKVGLSARVRWEESHNKDMDGANSNFMSVRLRPSVGYTFSPQASALLEAQYAKAFGQGVYNDLAYSGGTPSSAGTNTSSGSTKYPGDTLYVRQGYLALNMGWDISLIAGRQALAYGNEFILGVSDWGVYGRAFDAVRVRWTDGKSFVDVMDAQVRQLYVDQNNQTAGEKSFAGIYGSWNASDVVKKLDAYYFYQGDNGATTAGVSSFFGVYGARGVFDFGAVDARAEVAQNFGTGGAGATSGTAGTTGPAVPDDKDMMFETEIGWNFERANLNRLAFEFFTAGKNWTDFYPSTHAAFGESDVLGRRDVTGFALKYKINFLEKWQAVANWYYMQKTSGDGLAYMTDSVTRLGTGTSDAKNLGHELDLVLKYKMDPRVTLSSGYGHLILGDYLKDVGTDHSNTHYAWVMMEAKYP